MKELGRKIMAGVTASDVIRPGTFSSFVNPFSYLRLRARPDLFAGIDRWGVDGASMQWLLRAAWRIDLRRTSFDYTSLAGPVFKTLALAQARVYVIGSQPESIEVFAAHLQADYPGLNLVGTRHGFFDSRQQRDEVAAQVVSAAPDFVLVGMGAVLQEEFLLALRALGYAGAAATCGGFLHQTATHGRRYYPAWIDRFNLRALYRMVDEPRLAWRYAIDYPYAYVRILADLLVARTSLRVPAPVASSPDD